MRLFAIAIISCAACAGSHTTPQTPPPGFSTQGFTLSVIGTAADGLSEPMGLAFANDPPDQLWVVNRATDGVVIYTHMGASDQHAEARVDRYAQHFMAKVSGIAFSDVDQFATCQDSRDEWNDHPQAPDDFMGPTLWSADLGIFAMVGQAYPKVSGAMEGSHLDMLHESPLCTGIAHERANVFWTFDGLHGHIVRNDFVKDHGPGGASHSDGRVRRYPEATVHHVDDMSSQLAFDHDHGMLYVADVGADRVMRLDAAADGQVSAVSDPPQMEPLKEYAQVTGVAYDQVASIPMPAALAYWGGRIYVASASTGDIVAFDPDGTERGRVATGAKAIRGITIGPDGKLYYVDAHANTVTRIDP